MIGDPGKPKKEPTEEELVWARKEVASVREKLKEYTNVVDAWVKYLFAVNAGGAAATMAYMGALAGKGQIAPAKFPLLAFVIGLIATGAAIAAQRVVVAEEIDRRMRRLSDAFGLPTDETDPGILNQLADRLERLNARLGGAPKAIDLEAIGAKMLSVASAIAFFAFVAGAIWGVICIVFFV